MYLFLSCVRCHQEGSYGVGEMVPLVIAGGPTLQIHGYTMGPVCMGQHLKVLAGVYERLNAVAFAVTPEHGGEAWRAEVLDAELCKWLLEWDHPLQGPIGELFEVLGLKTAEFAP